MDRPVGDAPGQLSWSRNLLVVAGQLVTDLILTGDVVDGQLMGGMMGLLGNRACRCSYPGS